MKLPPNQQDSPMPLHYFKRKYGTSRTTLWRNQTAGLGVVRVGPRVFIRESDYIRFLETKTTRHEQRGAK